MVQQEVTATQWQQSIQQARIQFGATISRQLSSIELATSLPGLPDGEYGILIFSTEFANKSDAFETVPMNKSSGNWRPMGYFIR